MTKTYTVTFAYDEHLLPSGALDDKLYSDYLRREMDKRTLKAFQQAINSPIMQEVEKDLPYRLASTKKLEEELAERQRQHEEKMKEIQDRIDRLTPQKPALTDRQQRQGESHDQFLRRLADNANSRKQWDRKYGQGR